jgi:hypothetical protein
VRRSLPPALLDVPVRAEMDKKGCCCRSGREIPGVCRPSAFLAPTADEHEATGATLATLLSMRKFVLFGACEGVTTPPCSYYVLREDMLAYYLGDLTERLPKRDEVGGWEVSVVKNVSRTPLELNPSPHKELEATLHCIMSIQEAVPLEPNEHLSRLFSPEILGQLPVSGSHRIRRTVLSLIGTSPSKTTAAAFHKRSS